MSKISEQVSDGFKNSIPSIDEEYINLAIENTVKECSTINSPDRSSILSISFRLIRYTGWKIWLVQGMFLLVMLRLFVGFGGSGLISIPHASIRGLCIVSATIPFITLPFIYRSLKYHMNEIEMSTYHSFGQQLLIRFFIIGIGDLMMLVSGINVAVFLLKLQTISAIIYGMMPFLLLKTIILYVLSHYSLDNAFWFYGVIYLLSVVCVELFAKYYPLDSFIGTVVLISMMAILILLIIYNLKVVLKSVRYQELNLAK